MPNPYPSPNYAPKSLGNGQKGISMNKLIPKTAIVKHNDTDLIKAVAMDIGKEVAHHIETMYPNAVKAASSTFLLSVRNSTYNNIMSWLVIDAERTPKQLEMHDKFRRHMRAAWKQIRKEASL